METDSKHLFTRFCQLKEEIQKRQQELRKITPQVKNLMQEAQVASQKRTVVVRPRDFAPKVIEYTTTTRRLPLTPVLVGECLVSYLENSNNSPVDVDEFVAYLTTSVVSNTAETCRLSFKTLKPAKAVAQEEKSDTEKSDTEPEIVRY